MYPPAVWSVEAPANRPGRTKQSAYDDSGLPKTKNVLAKTKRECQEKLRQLTESMVGRNDRKVKPDMLFGDWLCYWYETHSKPTLRASTQNNYENVIYNHVLPEIG